MNWRVSRVKFGVLEKANTAWLDPNGELQHILRCKASSMALQLAFFESPAYGKIMFVALKLYFSYHWCSLGPPVLLGATLNPSESANQSDMDHTSGYGWHFLLKENSAKQRLKLTTGRANLPNQSSET